MKRTIQVRPYGEWRSPISTDIVTGAAGKALDLLVDGAEVCTCELRPAENGRTTVMHLGSGRDVLPEPFSVGSSVNEYGGSCSALANGEIFFSNFSDRRLYRTRLTGAPEPITPPSEDCFGDLIVDRTSNRLICVREDRDSGGESGHSLVAVDMAGESEIEPLFSGPDFLASPAISECGTQLAWISWDHPHMPFDESHLWVADIDPAGDVKNPRQIAKNSGEYVSQPRWSPEGELYFLSDRSGWTNIYRADSDGKVIPVCPLEAEFGEPLWQLGESSYAFVAPNVIIATYYQHGIAKLGSLHTGTGALTELSDEFADIAKVVSGNGKAWFLGAKVDMLSDLYVVDCRTKKIKHRPLFDSQVISRDILSIPELIEFKGALGLPTYAFYYPPTNPGFQGSDGESPPLIVGAHGGPTYRHSAALSFGVQFWTSRGFAYLDVLYGGSSGFGRDYRDRLRGRWGVTDVEDCVRGARYAQARFGLDPKRTAIRGASAGGFMTFAAIAFSDFFHAGASYFGISDLRTFSKETHRFESHYVDSLLGTGEEFEIACRERSAILHLDQIEVPLVIFQGSEDRIVPPNQAEEIAEKLTARGIPVVYRCYGGEGHGFKKKASLADAFQVELDFYASVFGFNPAST